MNLVRNFSGWFRQRLGVAALPLFFTMAFLPGIVHLLPWGFSLTNPLVASGPIVAGSVLAATLPGIRLNFILAGVLLSTLILAVNWLMLAGSGCCGTMH